MENDLIACFSKLGVSRTQRGIKARPKCKPTSSSDIQSLAQFRRGLAEFCESLTAEPSLDKRKVPHPNSFDPYYVSQNPLRSRFDLPIRRRKFTLRRIEEDGWKDLERDMYAGLQSLSLNGAEPMVDEPKFIVSSNIVPCVFIRCLTHILIQPQPWFKADERDIPMDVCPPVIDVPVPRFLSKQEYFFPAGQSGSTWERKPFATSVPIPLALRKPEPRIRDPDVMDTEDDEVNDLFDCGRKYSPIKPPMFIEPGSQGNVGRWACSQDAHMMVHGRGFRSKCVRYWCGDHVLIVVQNAWVATRIGLVHGAGERLGVRTEGPLDSHLSLRRQS